MDCSSQAPLSMGFSRQGCWRACHALLQGILLTQGLNQDILCLLHCRWILYHWATMEAQLIVCYAMLCYAKSLQSCPILCDPIEGSPQGSAIPEIFQARTLEWVAISFFYAWKWKVKVKSFSRAWLLVTPRTAAHQGPPSMGFSRQEYWSGVLLPSSPNWEYTGIYIQNAIPSSSLSLLTKN